MKRIKMVITALAAAPGWAVLGANRLRRRWTLGRPGGRSGAEAGGGWRSRDGAVALANAGLGLMDEHGVESLLIDPGASVPVGSRYLLYERGSGAQYCEVAAGVKPPLGPSSDSPYQSGDAVSIRRLGCRPGLELGIPGGAITIDHLVCCNTDGSGKIVDLTTLGNGTYWVVGRAVQTCAATDVECAYAPCYPYEITVSGGGGNYAYAGAGS